jgi:hypothetical protein
MAIPNYWDQVDRARIDWPDAWAHAHTGDARTEEFIRLLAARLYARDPRCGLNGKRGDPRDISDDVIAIRDEGSARDLVTGGAMEIIDVISGAGGPNPRPAWQVAPGGAGDVGTWVAPGAGPQPQPQPTPQPSLQSVIDALTHTDRRLEVLTRQVLALDHRLDLVIRAADSAEAKASITAGYAEQLVVDLANARGRLEDLVTAVDQARQTLAVPPMYTGRAFGSTLTLRPQR